MTPWMITPSRYRIVYTVIPRNHVSAYRLSQSASTTAGAL